MTTIELARRTDALAAELATRLKADGTYQTLLSEIARLDDDAYTPGLWEEVLGVGVRRATPERVADEVVRVVAAKAARRTAHVRGAMLRVTVRAPHTTRVLTDGPGSEAETVRVAGLIALEGTVTLGDGSVLRLFSKYVDHPFYQYGSRHQSAAVAA